MKDQLKMFGRYAITGGLAYAAGKGWISQAAAEPMTNLLVELVALGVTFAPPIYAAWKVSNAPKTP